MPLRTVLKNAVNRLLAIANLRIDTLTKDRMECGRLHALDSNSYFNEPIFPLPDSFRATAQDEILTSLSGYSSRFDSFTSESANGVGYTFHNEFYSSPDAEILYAIARIFQPRRIVEIGSGNSTRLFRQAIIDGNFPATLTSIDPHPRADVGAIADDVHHCKVEWITSLDHFRDLSANDLLFIDSSHELKAGNDCVFLFLRVLPEIRPGVIVHIHDIFLPFDYPLEWATATWAEQYIVQLMLTSNDQWEVLWPAHYLFRTQPELKQYFPHWISGYASSLWIRRKPTSLPR